MSAFTDGMNIGCRYNCLYRDTMVVKLCDFGINIELYLFIYMDWNKNNYPTHTITTTRREVYAIF